ncbi:hypothetical protein, partial [Corynebacterium diphtheriae]|uniref:hypothetical protein n=1 Tax=Corynebacterium diphtheriae TaxID=1717 RepID=UPI000D40518B
PHRDLHAEDRRQRLMCIRDSDYQDALDGISLTNTITPSGLGRTSDEQVKNLVGILDAGFIMDLSLLLI